MSWFERTLEVNGFPIKKAERDHRRLSGLPAHQLVEWIEHQRKAIVRHYLENSPYYRHLVLDHLQGKSREKEPENDTEVIETLLAQDLELLWSRLPIMTKSDLQRPLSERYAQGYTAKNTISHRADLTHEYSKYWR